MYKHHWSRTVFQNRTFLWELSETASLKILFILVKLFKHVIEESVSLIASLFHLLRCRRRGRAKLARMTLKVICWCLFLAAHTRSLTTFHFLFLLGFLARRRVWLKCVESSETPFLKVLERHECCDWAPGDVCVLKSLFSSSGADWSTEGSSCPVFSWTRGRRLWAVTSVFI